MSGYVGLTSESHTSMCEVSLVLCRVSIGRRGSVALLRFSQERESSEEQLSRKGFCEGCSSFRDESGVVEKPRVGLSGAGYRQGLTQDSWEGHGYLGC